MFKASRYVIDVILGFAFDMQDDIITALAKGDFSVVQNAYEYRFWLAESVLVLGSPATSAFEFVDSRGSGVEEVAIRVSNW